MLLRHGWKAAKEDLDIVLPIHRIRDSGVILHQRDTALGHPKLAIPQLHCAATHSQSKADAG
jgi:hypothetical protein